MKPSHVVTVSFETISVYNQRPLSALVDFVNIYSFDENRRWTAQFYPQYENLPFLIFTACSQGLQHKNWCKNDIFTSTISDNTLRKPTNNFCFKRV